MQPDIHQRIIDGNDMLRAIPILLLLTSYAAADQQQDAVRIYNLGKLTSDLMGNFEACSAQKATLEQEVKDLQAEVKKLKDVPDARR